MSFNERRAGANKHPWTLPQLSENDELARPATMHAAPPGNLARASSGAHTMGRAELARRKSDYFDEAFSVRGEGQQQQQQHPLRERIRGDSPVMLDIKTNVIVGDEFIFITELAAKLAERYRRPVSSIVVNVQHSQCLFFAGTFEPAYTATVSALGEYVQATTNRRNVYVLSEHLEDALGVPPARGLFGFVALAEENVGVDGKTVAQAVEETPNYYYNSNNNNNNNNNNSNINNNNHNKHRLSVRSLSNIRTSAGVGGGGGGEITPPTSADDVPPDNMNNNNNNNNKVARRRKSFVAGLFARRKENEGP